ncbi:MAG: M42 family peptidase [Clostridia bacterium]|nr:M42 family peptidase [Clostridia bacterium]
MSDYPEIDALLQALCAAPGVSGCESGAAAVAASLLEKEMPVHFDALGSVTGVAEAQGETLLLDAHIDQIGLVVTAVDETGFLKFARCGGADTRVLAAAQVTVHGKTPLPGVIISTPPHLRKGDEKKSVDFDDLAIDIGLTQAAAQQLVAPGDRVTFNGDYVHLCGNRVCAPAIDDRAGVAVVLRCLQLLRGVAHPWRLAVQFSVQEETGGCGAQTSTFTLRPKQAIGCDVSFASAPGIDKEKYAALGGGTMIGYAPALDYDMSLRLSALAQEKGIAAQPEVMGGRTGTNCDNIQVSRGGVRTALLSVPLRNMHTACEIVDLADLEASARLIAAYIAEGGVAHA